MSLYNSIGKNYDETRKADPYIVSRLNYHLGLNKGSRCLDIACGSGNYTIALDNEGLDMFGVDVSDLMLEGAKRKKSQIEWKLGNVKDLPYANEFFHAATCILAVHHFSSISIAFNEAYRILKPGGDFVIFTSTSEQMEQYWLKEYFPQMMLDSIKQMPSFDLLAMSLEKTGFSISDVEYYNITNDLTDLFLFSGKYRPEIYLDPKTIAGISSFANIAHSHEVISGLEKLSRDINTGNIQNVIKDYEHPNGDYLFLKAHK